MENILEITGLSKRYRSQYALKGVSISLKRGEILGLVGANGSGKSTLTNILAGNPLIQQTGGFKGEIIFDGVRISPSTPAESMRLGIGMVYQEYALVDTFTAAENIMLGRENRVRPFPTLSVFELPVIDRKKDIQDARSILSETGFGSIDPCSPVDNLSVGARQFVEFARVASITGLKLLMLDEPTAVLGRGESRILMDEVRRLAAGGVSVVFISHRIDEVLSLCPRVVVLRDGVMSGIFSSADTSVGVLAQAMIGEIGGLAHKKHSASVIGGREHFVISGMNCRSGGERLEDFSLEVKRGEIIGITGQGGQGQMLLGRAMAGLVPCEGSISIDGKEITPGDINSLFMAGFCYIPEERRRDGLLSLHSVAENILFSTVSVQKNFTSWIGLLKQKQIHDRARSYIDSLDIKCTGPAQMAGELSGGNQQKVILARAMSLSPEIMMIVEPTRGIDIGAKEVILNMLLDVNRERGTMIIIVSSELGELVRVCDRIAVLYEGRVHAMLEPDLPQEKFALAFAGMEWS